MNTILKRRLTAVRGRPNGWAVAFTLLWFGAGLSGAFAATLTLSPSNIEWNVATWADFDLNGISSGSAVNLKLYADVDRSGVADTNDVLLMQIDLEDGVSNSLGASIIACDTNGAVDGRIEGRVSYHGLTDFAQFWHADGQYLWQAEYTNGSVIATAIFGVAAPSGSVWVSGSVQALTNLTPMAGRPLPGAAVYLDVFSLIQGECPATWTDANGNFRLCVPSGISTDNVASVTAVRPGYFTSETGPDGTTPMSTHSFKQPPHAGTNALPDPLFLVPPIAGTVAALSGTVVDSASNALGGVLLWATMNDEEDDGGLSVGVSGSDGAFSVPWPQGDEENVLVISMTPALNMRGLAGSALSIDSVTSDISGLKLVCPVATTLVSGRVRKAEASDGVGGVDVRLSGEDLGAWSHSFSSDGDFELCLVGGTNFSAELNRDSLRPKRRACPTNEISGLTLPSSGSFTGLTFTTHPGHVLSGHVYDQAMSPLSGGWVYAQPVASGQDSDEVEVNLNGAYELLLPSDTYRVATWGFSDQGYVDQTWPSNVTVEASDVSGIDFQLVMGASISGTVLGAGSPLQAADVEAGLVVFREDEGWDWEHAAGTRSAADGTYALFVPPGTNYTVKAWGPQGTLWLEQYYNLAGDVLHATPVAALTGAPATGIDFDLQEGVPVSGRVTDLLGHPLGDVFVAVSKVSGEDWEWVNGANSGSQGDYMFPVPEGSNYAASVWPLPLWLEQCHDHLRDFGSATLFAAQSGQPVTNIDFSLVPAMGIEGCVTDATNGPVMTEVEVGQRNGTNWTSAWQAWSDSNGLYTCFMEADSNHLLRITDGRFHEVYYRGRLSPGAADSVSASQGTTVSNVDFKLYDPSADSDGDSLDDYIEGYVTGTDPFDSGDCLRCTALGLVDGRPKLWWSAVNGKAYRVERSTSLLGSPDWTNLTPFPVAAAGANASFADSNAPPRGNYRVLVTQ